MKRIIAVHALFSVFILGGVYSLISIVSGQSMSSTNYEIQSDSVNFGGGYSTSSNYQLESTAGEIATGAGTSSNYALYAGYQQMREIYLAVRAGEDIILSPALLGLTGGTSTGQVPVHVLTDSPTGYTMTIEAEDNPAMQGPYGTIANYAPSGANPDFVFTTDLADAHFGFSPEGSDVYSRFRDNGSACNIGSGETANRCWDALTVTPKTIAETASPNHPTGATTTIQFQVGIGGGTAVMEGVYTATTTVTVIPL